MKKIISIVIAIIILYLIVSITYKQNQNNTLKIGIILPLSGEYGALGENVIKGAELAKEEYVKNNPNSNIVLMAEDDVLDGKKGLSAYKKLVEFDKIDTLITASAPTFEVIYEDAKNKNLSVVSINTETKDETKDNVFSIRPANDSISFGLGQYLKNNKSEKTISVSTNDALVIKLSKSLTKGYGSEIKNYFLNKTNNDYSTIASKILADNPTQIIFSNYAADGAQIVKEILKQTQNKYRPQFVFDSLFNEGFIEYKKVLGDMTVLDGSIVISIKSDLDNNFKSLYKNKYNVEPPQLSDLGYDSVKVLLETFDKDKSKWITNMSEINNVKGAAGEIVFDSLGLRKSEFKITTLKNGEIPKY